MIDFEEPLLAKRNVGFSPRGLSKKEIICGLKLTHIIEERRNPWAKAHVTLRTIAAIRNLVWSRL